MESATMKKCTRKDGVQFALRTVSFDPAVRYSRPGGTRDNSPAFQIEDAEGWNTMSLPDRGLALRCARTIPRKQYPLIGQITHQLSG